MLNCYKFRLYPNAKQERILFRWIGCQRLIYNAKVQEDRYFRRFAQRMVGTAGKPVPVDQQYSQFITERRPLLRDVPSQILRNGAVKFHRAYQRFLKKLGGRPKFKKKSGRQAVWLSRESFEFIPQIDDQTGNIVSYQLSLDTKRFPVGITAYLAHRSHSVPSSIHIAVQGGRWWLSLAAEDTALTTPGKNLEAAVEQIAEDLRHLSADQLAKPTQGGDRGVAKPLTTSDGKVFDIGPVLKTRIKKSRQRHKKWQQRASRRKQGSKNQKQAYRKAARYQQYEKMSGTSTPIKRITNWLPTMRSLGMSSRTCVSTISPNDRRPKKRCQRPVSSQSSESQSRAQARNPIVGWGTGCLVYHL